MHTGFIQNVSTADVVSENKSMFCQNSAVWKMYENTVPRWLIANSRY